MTLADQLAPILALAAGKGVEVVPGWLHYEPGEDGDSVTPPYQPSWNDTEDGTEITENAAALIVTGSLSAWLAEQGIVVGRNVFGYWWWKETHGEDPADDGNVGTDYLSALLAAATARLAELPNKENT